MRSVIDPQTTLDRFPGESPFHLTMVHDLYCVQVLKQREEPISVSAQLHRDARRTSRFSARATAIGRRIRSHHSRLHFLTPAGMPADGFDRMEVFGRDWTARVSSNPRPLELWDDAARATDDLGNGMTMTGRPVCWPRSCVAFAAC